MKFQILIVLLLCSLLSINAQTYGINNPNDSEKSWVLKARIIPSTPLTSLGIGLEKQINSNFSALCLVNFFRFQFTSDSPSNISKYVTPELRYHFDEFSDKSFFISKFLEFGDHSISKAGEIDESNYTHNKGGSFFGGGFLIGKNMILGKKFHLDTYIGPRYRWQNETIVETIDNEASESNGNDLKLGLRVGINLNFRFN